jgi:hypothetical protein
VKGCFPGKRRIFAIIAGKPQKNLQEQKEIFLLLHIGPLCGIIKTMCGPASIGSSSVTVATMQALTEDFWPCGSTKAGSVTPSL